jgi:tetratricopeptide (TPR) repeat protein
MAYQERSKIYYKQAQFDKAMDDDTMLIKTTTSNMTLTHTDWMFYENGNIVIPEIEDIIDAINKNPADVAALFYEGKWNYRNKNYNDAIKYYTQALNHKPDMGIAYLYRAIAYEENRDYGNAIKDYVSSWDMIDAPNFVFFRLAYLYTDKHDFEKAIEYLSEVLKKDSEDIHNAYENRAILYEELHQFDKALKDYTTLIDLYAWNKSTYHNKIAEIYIKTGLFDKAIAECNEAMRDGASLYNKEGTVIRGRAYMKQGNIQAALTDFNTVMETDFSSFCNTNFYRGLLFLEQGEYEKALQDFTGVNAYSFPEVWEKRSVAYLALGKTKEAEEALESMKKRTEYKSLDRYSRKLFVWIEI